MMKIPRFYTQTNREVKILHSVMKLSPLHIETMRISSLFALSFAYLLRLPPVRHFLSQKWVWDFSEKKKASFWKSYSDFLPSPLAIISGHERLHFYLKSCERLSFSHSFEATSSNVKSPALVNVTISRCHTTWTQKWQAFSKEISAVISKHFLSQCRGGRIRGGVRVKVREPSLTKNLQESL